MQTDSRLPQGLHRTADATKIAHATQRPDQVIADDHFQAGDAASEPLDATRRHANDNAALGAFTGVVPQEQRGGGAVPASPQHDAAAQIATPVNSPATAASGTASGAERIQAVIHEPVGSPQWNERFASTTLKLAQDGVQTAQIRIDPPDLGPVDITITMNEDAETHATVHFSSQHAVVRETIESALPRLREMMAQAGIALGEATVSPEQNNRESGQQPGNHVFHADAAGTKAEPPVAMRLPAWRSAGSGVIDTFA